MEERKTSKSIGKKKMIADAILVCTLLLVSLSAFLIMNATKRDGAYARVTVDGEEVMRCSLSEDREYSLNGGTNILVIENGQARVVYASCPDGLCINQGEISMSGERIVCLPNRVMVEIVGADGAEVE